MNFMKDLTSFINNSEKPLIVILGPTASGKTGLSLELAQKFDGEIISTDSRQIYEEMEIGTAMILPNEQKGVPHHMLSITTPDKTLTLGEYKELVLKEIAEIQKREHIPMLVGGTGLYISAIIEGYDVPRVAPNEKLRKKLNEEATKHGSEYIHEKLKKLDPEAAEKIHPNNTRYVIRAIEINKGTKSAKPDKKSGPQFDVFMIGINWPREKLYDRINQRVEIQVKEGLLEEVRKLLRKGYAEELPSMSSLGVKEIIPFLRGEQDLEECKETLKKNTRNYAKRQMTWFRRYDNVHWLTPEDVKKITQGS